MRITTRGSGRGVAGAIVTFLCASAAFAEAPAINGYTDLQYIYSLEKPANGTNSLRSYDAQDNNMMSTTHLAITGKVSDEASYVVEVDAGNDADTTAGSGEDVVIQEGYLVYASPSKWGFKAGKFATYEGIEVIESVANPTISRGFLYGLAEPFTHVGGVVTYAPGKFDFALGAVNGWDQQDDVNKGKTIVAKVGMNFGDPLALTISGLTGPEQASVENVNDDPATPLVDETVLGDEKNGDNRHSIDVTGVTKVIPNVDFFFQGNWGYEENTSGTTDDKWMGFALEPVLKVGSKWTFGFRYEYFWNDEGSRVGGVDNTALYNLTFTPGYKVTDNVTVRAEIRQDKSNNDVFTDDDGLADDTNTTIGTQVALTF